MLLSIQIPEYWRRIAGLHVEDDGTVGCVFLAHDTTTSVVHCHDACKFDREVLAVIGQGISGRGKWIPLAYRKQDQEFAEKLLDMGVNVLPEPSAETPSMAEVIAREIWQRLRSNQFRVDRGVAEWLTEYKSFYRNDNKVPLDGYPLMSATRYAIEMLAYAKPQGTPGGKRRNYPEIPVT